jgi:hypothetical protein
LVAEGRFPLGCRCGALRELRLETLCILLGAEADLEANSFMSYDCSEIDGLDFVAIEQERISLMISPIGVPGGRLTSIFIGVVSTNFSPVLP